jgi:hypothetical protein
MRAARGMIAAADARRDPELSRMEQISQQQGDGEEHEQEEKPVLPGDETGHWGDSGTRIPEIASLRGEYAQV